MDVRAAIREQVRLVQDNHRFDAQAVHGHEVSLDEVPAGLRLRGDNDEDLVEVCGNHLFLQFGVGAHEFVGAGQECGYHAARTLIPEKFDAIAAHGAAHGTAVLAIDAFAVCRFNHAVAAIGHQHKTVFCFHRHGEFESGCSRNMRAIVPLLPMPSTSDNRLVWVDLEMTGLDPDSDSIMEVATSVTDADLNERAQGPVYAISHDESELQAMDDWNTEHHTAPGLWKRVLESHTSMREAEQGTLEFLAGWVEAGVSPMCGNSICQDRRFMYRLMPELEQWFHYRNLDVSTIKELVARWAPDILLGFEKNNQHEALEDIRESIAELRYYRPFMGRISGCNNP